MPEGKEIGKAYVTVNLDDRTDADYERIRAGIASKPDITIGTKLGDPSGDPLASFRERARSSKPVDIPVAVDTTEAQQGLRNLGSTADQETQRTTSAVNNASRTSALAWVAMFAGMPVAAATAAVATVASLGAVEAGFIGLGAYALKSNAQVSESWRGLGANLKSEAAGWAQPLARPFVDSASQIQGTMDRLSPAIRAAFANSAPGVKILTDSVDDFATRAMPGLVVATASSTAPLLGLKSVAQQAGAGVTDFFVNISQGAQSSQAVLVTTGGIIRDFEGFAGALFANLTNNGGPALAGFRGALQQAEQTLLALTSSGSAVYGFFNGVTSGLSGMITLVRAASSVLSVLPHQLTGFAGAFASTAMVASKFGVDIGASFNGLGGKIREAASAGDTFGSKMRNVAGAVGPALFNPTTVAVGVLSAGLMILGQQQQQAAAVAQAQADRTRGLTQALIDSNGAIDANVQKSAVLALQNYDTGKGTTNLLDTVKQLAGPEGMQLLAQAYTGNTAAGDKLRGMLQSSNDAYMQAVASGGKLTESELLQMSANKQLMDALGGTSGQFASASNNAQSYAATLGALKSAEIGAAVASVTGVQAIQQQITVGNAQSAISDRLRQANQQVAQSSQGVASAQHSLAQSGVAVSNAQHGVAQAQLGVASANQAVANAEHGVEQSQRSLAQAYQGVTTAERAHTQAERDELVAEQDLNKARQQSIQDLKDLHLQLADQVVSQQQAAVNLFDSQTKAATVGVTASNAQAIAGQQVTATNVDQIKAALDLLSAQNQLNDAENQSAKLKGQVNAADQAGVAGSQPVLAAQKALASAQDQVASTAQAVQQAHQQVTDAEWSLHQADIGLANSHQGVRDAAWSLTQAENGVRDAQWSQQQAAVQLHNAQVQLKQAHDAASTSLDTNTAAGRTNLGALLSLWDAIQKQGGPVQQQYRTLVDDTARAFGWSTDQAQTYLTKLGLIPKDFRYNVTAVGGVDLGAIGSAVNGVAKSNFWSIGNYAEGGHVKGAGGPKDDLINARLSDNEFVQPAEAVDHYGVGFMQAVQQKRLPKGGDGASLPGFASGGLVKELGAEAQLASAGTAYQSGVNALEVAGFPHPPGLPAYVPPAADMSVGGAVNYAAGAGVAQWTPQILQALGLLGQSSAWLGTVQRRMQQESGGNPNIVNKWDSNWAKGTPSVGLMQVIGPTFRSNAGQFVGTGPFSYGVSVDPLANTFAGLNYAIHRYGSLSALNRPGGYDDGGFMLDQPGINTTGKPEMVLPPNLTDTLLGLHELVQSFKSAPPTGGGPAVHVNVQTMPMDPHETAQVAARELVWALRNH